MIWSHHHYHETWGLLENQQTKVAVREWINILMSTQELSPKYEEFWIFTYAIWAQHHGWWLRRLKQVRHDVCLCMIQCPISYITSRKQVIPLLCIAQMRNHSKNPTSVFRWRFYVFFYLLGKKSLFPVDIAEDHKLILLQFLGLRGPLIEPSIPVRPPVLRKFFLSS